MFSLQKILALVVIVLAVWYGFKLITRLDRARREKLKDSPRESVKAETARPQPAKDAEVVDLVRKPDGTYGAPDRDRRA